MDQYKVYGWLNSNSFEKDKTPDITINTFAMSEEHAEEIADEIFKSKIGICDVIEAERTDE